MTAPHLDDLALARRCAEGDEEAWERFVLEYRPVLYRAADALDPSGGARDLADSLYADLYGLRERDGQRRSLFDYFQGRSSLATWLRAVLAQRFVDRVRSERRLAPLPDELDDRSASGARDSGQPRTSQDERHAALFRDALASAVGLLSSRDRLRLGCYYVQDLTLAQTGRAIGEHEATVSRQLARTRRALRTDVERRLRRAGLGGAEITECFAGAVDDAGELDLAEMLRAAERKESAPDRSI